MLGALIAVNLKNTLLQLSDPYYLWKKSKLDCVSWKAWHAILCCLFFFPSHIFILFRRSLSSSVCGLCRSWPPSFSACLMELLLEWAHPSWWWYSRRSCEHSPLCNTLSHFFFFCHKTTHQSVNCVCVCFFFFFAVVMVRLWFRLWIRISTRTRRCTVRYEKYIFVCIFVVTHHIRVFLFLIPPQVTSITGVKIVNYCSPLYFANAEIFRQRVIRKVQWQEWPLGVCVCVTYGCLYSYVFVSRPVWTRASLSWPGGSS